MSLDLTKPVQTRDGHEVRIYASFDDEHQGIHGATKDGGKWTVRAWRLSGNWCVGSIPHVNDLVNVPRKFNVTKWVRFDRCNDGDIISCTYNYVPHKIDETVAIKKVVYEFTEGEGL